MRAGALVTARTLAAVAFAGLAVAGCGGQARRASDTAAPTGRPSAARRVCDGARDAARGLLGNVRLRVAGVGPADIECVLGGRGIHVDVVAQATALAWTEYDTTIVHQVQAYGSGAVHVAAQLPRRVRGVAGNASWIPGRRELVATNGTQEAGGSYVTVEVTRASAHGPSSLSLARAVARATLAAAPRGPKPAPPPG